MMTDQYREKRVYLYRHGYSGRSVVVPCRLALLGPEHFVEAERLHFDATRGLGPEIFVPTDREDLQRLLTADGISIGVWYEDELVCMRAVQIAGDWVNYTLEKMEMEPDANCRTAITDHCVVSKRFRGNNVQFLTHYEIEYMIADRCDTILTTVAPSNIFSLKNILACNFQIMALGVMYGGFLRYTLVKEFTPSKPIWTNWHHNVPIRDVERQQKLIANGCIGYKLLRTSPKGFSILYAPENEERPEYYEVRDDGYRRPFSKPRTP